MDKCPRMNMNLGILTFHRAVNYGAVFQTYALKQALENLGINASIVDYRCNAVEEPYNPCVQVNNLKTFLTSILTYSNKKKKQKNFETFIDTYLKPVPFNADNFSALITGSDQVWNTAITGGDLVYFLEVNKPDITKVSYAACTGKVKYSADEKNHIAELLDLFDAISVRDDESYETIKLLTKQPITRTIDPTLLVEYDDWKEITSPVEYKNYILVFAVGFSERLSDFAHDLAEKEGKEIIFINSNLRKKGPGIYLDTASPDIVLGLINNADYVVTNSFHGTAMSLAMKKEFFVELEHDKKGRNNRVESLLNNVSIKRREIITSQYNEEDFSPINWYDVQNNIIKERESSLEFLKKALNL